MHESVEKMHHLKSADYLAVRPVPDLSSGQLEYFTLSALRIQRTHHFDSSVVARLLDKEEDPVLAIDIGGDKLAAASYAVRNGALRQTTLLHSRRGESGSGYLHILESLASFAREASLFVGLSFAGLTNDTKLIAGPNVPVLAGELFDHYDGDFANLFPLVTVVNDAEAGAMSSIFATLKLYPDTKEVVFVVNGSGLGGAVLSGNSLYAVQPGHIEALGQLNVFGQDKPCGMLGATYVCLESLAASKAGVEDIWYKSTGQALDGRGISARYQSGDRLAIELYDSSAVVTAHAIRGMGKAFELFSQPGCTTVIEHGGIFEVPGYAERVKSILKRNLSYDPQMILTRDFTTNACLDGAAIAALMNSSGLITT